MVQIRHRQDVEHENEQDVTTGGHDPVYARFGGTNVGAGFFGWLVAVATTVLLTGIIGAVAAAVSDTTDITQSDAERRAGTIGVTAAVVLVVVLLIGYYAGGYVAGRMSRFDGGRQGRLVWVIGVVVTVLALAVGWVVGYQYNVLDRVDLPRIPIGDADLTTGGIVTGLVALIGTLLAAMAGGMVGQRYHKRVDRYAER